MARLLTIIVVSNTRQFTIRRHFILLKELIPFTFIVIIWLVHLAQAFLSEDWAYYSLYPRNVHGLIGIITSPLLHSGWEHLIGNTVPLIVLGFLLHNSYREISGKIFWLTYLLNGVLLWLFARDAFHLGASGVVYGLASFLMFSGFIRRHPQLAMISFLVIFLYGSMVWGIFPFDPHVSWEAHLYGGLTGLMLSIVYRKEGPQKRKYFENEKEEVEEIPIEEMGPHEQQAPLKIVYSFKEKPGINPHRSVAEENAPYKNLPPEE